MKDVTSTGFQPLVQYQPGSTGAKRQEDSQEVVPQETVHLRTFQGDANSQAKQLAKYADRVRAGDPKFCNAFGEASQRIAAGESATWELPAENLEKLSPASREALAEALIDVQPLDPADKTPFSYVHTKTLIFDEGNLADSPIFGGSNLGSDYAPVSPEAASAFQQMFERDWTLTDQQSVSKSS